MADSDVQALTILDDDEPVTGMGSPNDVDLGQWYWVKETVTFDYEGRKKGDTYEWLGCVMEIGSNYVELRTPPSPQGYTSDRVHFDRFFDRCRHEPQAHAYIQGRVEHYQAKTQDLLGQVQALTARLGVAPTMQIAQTGVEGENRTLAVLSTQVDTTVYKAALVEAKETLLPDLFKQIKQTNHELVRWMSAPALEMEAKIAPMKDSIKVIDDRIYTISLYAGLAEEAEKVRDGDPAAMGEKLHVFQRRLYMDEECLLQYEAGGMEFKDIRAFDEWLSREENLYRLLPFPRTLVAFRVRREDKERESNTFMDVHVNIELKEADKRSFLYARNGDQLWRVDCDFMFDEMIFPNEEDGGGPMMIKSFGRSVDKMMPLREYEERKAEYDRIQAASDAWRVANPDVSWIHNPHRTSGSFNPKEWEPFDPSSVYFDQALEKVQAQVKAFNRIAVIIQGLFDRSEVLHPHPPVRVWDPHSFERSITLVFDAATLTHGDKPDFDAYRNALNASIGVGTIVTGQDDYWAKVMADRENERQANDYRVKNSSNYRRFRPHGNPGPGKFGPVQEWRPRAKSAVFRWKREAATWGFADVSTSITVPASALLNVSAYKPGDFKQFFADPRTRAEYFKWAPLLLAAEDYHAGKVNPRMPRYEWN